MRMDGGHWLQHQPSETGGRAEKLRRPARSEMAGQDRESTSRLQRRDHDRDLRAVARARLAVLRETGTAENPASAVGGRSPEKTPAGRARRHGRWQRL